jgi:hypothetical protein
MGSVLVRILILRTLSGLNICEHNTFYVFQTNTHLIKKFHCDVNILVYVYIDYTILSCTQYY